MFALVAVLAQKTAPPVLFLKDNLLSHNEIRRVPCGALFFCKGGCHIPNCLPEVCVVLKLVDSEKVNKYG